MSDYETLRAAIHHDARCDVSPCDCGAEKALDVLYTLSAAGVLGTAETPEARLRAKIETALALRAGRNASISWEPLYYCGDRTSVIKVRAHRGDGFSFGNHLVDASGFGETELACLENLARYLGVAL